MLLRPLALLLVLTLAACADAPEPDAVEDGDTLTTLTPSPDLDTTATPMSARGILEGTDTVATLSPTEGNDVRGRVTFAEVEDGVLVVAEVTGLSQVHGFHIHETGDCSTPDASSAGGHYNPTDAPHGAPGDPASERHVGDLGNVEAGADGTARYERVDPVISLSGPNSIIGKAVIVHAGQDDYTSQPTGEAGGRLACGVITAG